MKFQEHQEMLTAIINWMAKYQENGYNASKKADSPQQKIMLAGKSNAAKDIILHIIGKYPKHINLDQLKSNFLKEKVTERLQTKRDNNNIEPSDSMDGDFDSAMRDAGLGTDEDYGPGASEIM